MSQVQFGVWCAISIHDTSSVIAAATLFGDNSAQIAIILKLVRTLWLIPLLIFAGLVENRQILGLVCHGLSYSSYPLRFSVQR